MPKRDGAWTASSGISHMDPLSPPRQAAGQPGRGPSSRFPGWGTKRSVTCDQVLDGTRKPALAGVVQAADGPELAERPLVETAGLPRRRVIPGPADGGLRSDGVHLIRIEADAHPLAHCSSP